MGPARNKPPHERPGNPPSRLRKAAALLKHLALGPAQKRLSEIGGKLIQWAWDQAPEDVTRFEVARKTKKLSPASAVSELQQEILLCLTRVLSRQKGKGEREQRTEKKKSLKRNEMLFLWPF